MATTPNSNPNQLNEKELKKLIELLQKIDKLTEAAAVNQANQAQLAGNARQQLDRFEKEWKDITGDISFASVGFSKMLEEIKNSNEGLNESLRAYRGLRSLTEEIQYYQKGISNMSEKDVVKLREKAESEKVRLVNANELLKAKQKTLETDKESNKDDRFKLMNSIMGLKQELKSSSLIGQQRIIKEEQLKVERFRLRETREEYEFIGKQLKKNNSTLEQNTAILNNFDAYAEGLELTLQKITKEIKQQNVENLDKQFKRIVKETSSTDENLAKITKSFGFLTNLAQKVLDHQSGISELSEKEAKTALKKFETEKKTLLKADEGFKKEQSILETEKNINTALLERIGRQVTNLKIQKASGKWDDEKEEKLINIESLYQKQSKTSEELNDKLKLNRTAQKKILSVITEQDEAYNTLRSDLNKIYKETRINFINNVDEGFKNLVEGIHSTDDSVAKLNKSFISITSIAQKIQDHQSGINELNEKDVKKLIEKYNTEKKILITNYESLKTSHKNLKNDELSNKASLTNKKQEIDTLEILKTQQGSLFDKTTELENHQKEYQSLLEKQNDIVSELEVNEAIQGKTYEIIKGQNKEYNEIRAILNEIAVQTINKIDEGFKNMVNDIATTDQISKDMSKSFQTLADIAQKNQEYQENIADVNKKDIEELIKKAELEKQGFTRNLKLLDLEKQRLEASSTTNKETLRNTETEINALKNQSTLTEDEKNNLIELEIKKANLIESEDEITRKLKTNEKLTEKTQEYISGQNKEYNKLNDTLKDTEKRVNNINKSFGLNVGKNLKEALNKTGFGRLADMLGIDDATKKMAKLTAKYTDYGKQALTFGQQFKVMGGGLMSMGSNLLKGFNPWLIAITGIIKAVQFFVDAMFEADKQVTNLAKNLVISKDAAREVRNRFSEITNNTSKYNDLLENQLISQKEIVNANLKINEILGTSIDLSSQLGKSGESIAREFAIVSKFLKLSEEEQRGLLSQFLISNKELKNTDTNILQISKRILGVTSLYKAQTGILINERKVLENVLKTSNYIRLSVKGGLDGLTKSVIEAQKLGLSLEKISGIADGLLQFETSITAELEAELLLGKSFNLEKARLAALNNDFETLATEIQREIGTAEEFGDMNRIQQGAIAAIFSMSKDEFANMLVEQESLSKARGEFQKLGDDAFKQIQKTGALTDKQLQALKAGKGTVLEYYQALKAVGKSSEDLSAALGDLAYQSLSSQDAQEKFNEALEKAKETFTRFVDGGSLDKLADFITRFVTSVEQKGLWDTLTGGLMSTSEVKELQTQKQVESLDKQIAEKKAKGEDISQLEEQRKGLSAEQTKQQYLKSLEYKPAEGDIDQMLFGKSNLQQKAAGETYLLEDITRIIDNLFGGFAGVQANQERRTREAQQQLEKAEKEYTPSPQNSDSRLATEPIKGQDLVVQMQDGIIKKNKGLKENGGLVIAKFNQGELQPIAQGIKQDQAFALSTNKAMSTPSFTKNNIIETISAAIAKLTENELLLSEILKGSLITEPTKPKDLLEATLQGGIQGGIGGALFSVVNHLMEPSIEPVISPIESSNIKTESTNNTTLVNSTPNVDSNEEVVRTLREAINVLKAIQTKDTNVQLSLDGEVVARKLSPYTPQYLMKDFSSLG